jgi:hypothetical protein
MNKKPMKKYKIAVLDDYQNAALECVDWSVLRHRSAKCRRAFTKRSTKIQSRIFGSGSTPARSSALEAYFVKLTSMLCKYESERWNYDIFATSLRLRTPET